MKWGRIFNTQKWGTSMVDLESIEVSISAHCSYGLLWNSLSFWHFFSINYNKIISKQVYKCCRQHQFVIVLLQFLYSFVNTKFIIVFFLFYHELYIPLHIFTMIFWYCCINSSTINYIASKEVTLKRIQLKLDIILKFWTTKLK